jgi:hypothetical protein
MSSNGLQDLNFKVDPAFHLAFKAAATANRMSMKDLLEESFREWLSAHQVKAAGVSLIRS